MVSPEVEPFAKTGGLGDVLGSLPKELARLGHDVRVMMPKYGVIPEKYQKEMVFIDKTYTKVAWRDQYVGAYELKKDGVIYYFLDNEYYFKNGGIYSGDYDLERFSFFSRASLEILQTINFFPDILHCHDWQAAAIPVLWEYFYSWQKDYKDIKTVFTIHNLRFQGEHCIPHINDLLGLPLHYFAADKVGVGNGDANLIKAGIVFADFVTTVSPTYAREIMTPEFGEGLDRVLRSKEFKLGGILNGIDYSVYSPKKNKSVNYNYETYSAVEGKALNKKTLQKKLGLPVRDDIPLISIVSRLTSQKGIDIILYALNELMGEDVQFVVLGTGDANFENSFKHFAWIYKEKFSANISFSNKLSHQIYAGSDMFLMPSLYEPCGLGQLIALSYGTIPIVRETGGLKDTVSSYNEETGEGNGFSFAPYNAGDMMWTIRRALEFYKDKKVWNKIVESAMQSDYSWTASAGHYINIYDGLINKETE